MSDLVQIEDKTDIFKERFGLGHIAVMSCFEGNPVGYLWAYEGPAHAEQRCRFSIEVRPHELYYYDSFVLPAYRVKSVFGEMLSYSVSQSDLKRQFRDVVGIVEVDNLRSIRAHERLGFNKTQLRVFAILLGKHIHRALKTY